MNPPTDTRRQLQNGSATLGKRSLGIATIVLTFALSSPRAGFGQTSLPQPCTSIPVQLIDTIDTAKARTGDVFRFQTIDTIIASDRISIPRGATGYGVITFASSAGAHGKAGDLIVEIRYIEIPAHGQYQVTIDSESTSAVQAGATHNVSNSVAAIPLPYVGTAVGAFNYFHAGKNAVIKAGSRFIVVPVGNLEFGKRCTP